MERGAIFQSLNGQQREAVEAVGGPVCILAGAGSGKTTTVTRRIANQVLAGSDPSAILAVTFTDKAAGEMRSRLARLGVEGVRARTFHAAALQQLNYFSPERPPQIMASKVLALRQIANTLPKPYRFRPAADLATEIEWAKNRRVDASAYLASLDRHEPPIPGDLMASVYKRYEAGKRSRSLMDFEDLLESVIQMFGSDETAIEEFRARYGAFTVDEYQDVNLLQETLLRIWLGERDELCVVGDDYQAIYGFTGATPRYLLEMPQRYVRTKVVRLEANYRSTPQILAVANRLARGMDGADKTLRATRGDGPGCTIRSFATASSETAFLIGEIARLNEQGVSYEDMAILYRLNFRSEDYEEGFAAKGIPYQVRDGAFLTRQTARHVLTSLASKTTTEVAREVRQLADRAGYLEDTNEELGEREVTRQNDLRRFIHLAEEFDDGARTCREFVEDIQGRFGTEGGRGVNLLTYHRAKGLEFEAVFLPQLQDGELPFRRSTSNEAIAEERRLLYVGITRAKTHLAITWAGDGRRKPSPFLGELGERQAVQGSPSKPFPPPTRKTAAARVGAKPFPPPAPDTITARLGLAVQLSGGLSGEIVELGETGVTVAVGDIERTVEYGERVTADGTTAPLVSPESAGDGATLDALKRWRRQRAGRDGVPAFVVFHDSTLEEIVKKAPATLQDLGTLPGIGAVKLERYGAELLGILHGSPERDGQQD